MLYIITAVHRKIVKRSLKAGIALAVAALGTEIALIAYHPLAAAAFWLRSSPAAQCNAEETVHSVAYHRRYDTAHKQILESSRLVRQDGDLQLWDVPGMREFWILGAFD